MKVEKHERELGSTMENNVKEYKVFLRYIQGITKKIARYLRENIISTIFIATKYH